MEKVRIEDIKPGMILARTIYGTDGRILIRESAEISDTVLQKLKGMGLPAAYIKAAEEEVKINELVSEATRTDLVRSLSKLDAQVRSGGDVNLISSKRSLYDLVDEIMCNQKNLVGLNDIRFHNDYTYGHSVNVTIIAVKIGLQMGYNQLKMADLAVGALFHDIGMTKVPLEVLDKQGNLTDSDLKLIYSHPEQGYNMLRQNHDVSTVSAHVAYQHHERFNGSGYPRGMVGETIHEFARIVAVADVYDALTTEKIYRPAKPIWEALQIIDNEKGVDFDPQVVDIFVKVIG